MDVYRGGRLAGNPVGHVKADGTIIRGGRLTGDSIGHVREDGTVVRGGRWTGSSVGYVKDMTDIRKAAGAALLLLLS
ncbi:hypothetical protein [Streptomyces litmocidini]|uniref:Uncharacterized protein n=1 Tax=Streptomyces litmocidini TaxID=67318 RepID=A0ABW7U3Q3_9ACTN